MTATAGAGLTGPGTELVGRTHELATLRLILADDGPRVVFLHGIGGVGKSALLDAFCASARDDGAAVVRLDGGAIEPTARGFTSALSSATGAGSDSAASTAARHARGGPPRIVVIDRYEVLRPLDLWLRQSFVPSMPADTRLVLAGREPPVADWRFTLGDWFASLSLGNLERAAAFEVLRREGTDERDLERIERLARGHPLSLRLAAAALVVGSTGDREAAPMSAIIDQLTELYLTGLDASTREALDAASVVRRPTLSLLAAMLPGAEAQKAFDRLRRLPFVELGAEGLMVHDTVRESVDAYLRASDPDRRRRYRIAAWRQLREEVSRAGTSEMWRYTADLLYLLENPMIRGVFFPTTEHRYSVDGPRPSDWPSIEALVRETESPATLEILSIWWQRNPLGFRIARDAAGSIAGLEVSGLDSLPRSLIDLDPVARRWHHHLQASPVPSGQKVLFDRFDLTGPDPTTADAVMAALMLDLKRRYMELRPDLRRIYTAGGATLVGTPWEQLGFAPVPGGVVHVVGEEAYPAFLDFGPASVDGWLTRVIATELNVDDDQLLDFAQRQLVVDGRRVDLTKLEAEVLRCLVENPYRVVDRATLLHEAWGYDDPRGSNVLEAQVKGIRRKLGHRAATIETVRGIGYRFVPNVPV